jgi:hypothetical protein
LVRWCLRTSPLPTPSVPSYLSSSGSGIMNKNAGLAGGNMLCKAWIIEIPGLKICRYQSTPACWYIGDVRPLISQAKASSFTTGAVAVITSQGIVCQTAGTKC